MNKKFLFLLAFILLGGFLLTNTRLVQAAQNQIQSVLVTNFPELFKTREQNVDSNGNIKVHEQGTVSVNVGNTPLAVTVTNQATSSSQVKAPKTIRIWDSQTLGPSDTLESQYYDVEGYSKIALFVFAPIGGSYTLNADLLFAPEGEVGFYPIDANRGIQMNLSGSIQRRYAYTDVVGPRAIVIVHNNNSPTVTAYLYLIP